MSVLFEVLLKNIASVKRCQDCRLSLLGSVLVMVTMHICICQSLSAQPADKAMGSTKDHWGPVTGQVLSGEGEHLSHVAVLVKGTKIGMVTNEDGYFSIQLPEDRDTYTLIFSYIGYNAKQVI